MRACWCGNADVLPFGSGYGECRACGTLVNLADISSDQLLVHDDEKDFYGRNYWLERQESRGYPHIHARARHDLTERNLHWLGVLLRYRLPPAVALEVGSAHGGFVALLREAGYEASGIELSPWVVEFSQGAFGIPVRAGPIENLDLAASSLDIVILMDVLEHLLAPAATIQRCVDLLKPDGLLLIQTPRFDDTKTFDALVESQDRFLEMLIPDEHIHLFSRRSVSELLRRVGVEHVYFEPAICADYDMFLVASRTPRPRANAPEAVEAALLSTPHGRVALALLDLRRRELELAGRLEAADSDRAARGGQVESLTQMLRQSETDRVARGEQIETLTAALARSESDRAARHEQIETLTAALARSESDRAARYEQIETLTAALGRSESDRAARHEQIETLTAALGRSESDRAARHEQIEMLTGTLARSESDRAARQEQIETLTAALARSESDRAARGAQVDTLTGMVRRSEADRASDHDRIKALMAQVARLEADQERFRALLSRWPLRWLRRLCGWPQAETPPDRRPGADLRTIAVDLTPLLPGADNGGAKIFVLELLRRLAELYPATRFVLLTQRASHQELSALDRENVRRLVVVEPVADKPPRQLPRLLGFLPRPATELAARVVRRLRSLIERRRPRTLLRDLRANLLFCPFTAPTWFEPGVPTVCTIYDLQYKAYPQFFAPEECADRGRTFKEACLRATVLVAISDYSRRVAIAEGEIDQAVIRTIHLRMAKRSSPNAVQPSEVLATLGLARGRYLIYPANFWRHKNHEMLLTAFGIACRSGMPADIKLVCTGAPGQRQQWLKSAADRMMPGRRVLLPGFLPDADFSTLLADSLAVVYPSLYEGFGLPLIEAMAAGVPVACSSATSLPEVGGDAVMYFNPCVPTEMAEAMISLVEDDRLRGKLIAAGKERASQFSDSEGMARSYWEVFQHAVDNPRRGNLLTGAYRDGWSGPKVMIQVAPDEATGTLEIEVAAPEWHPARRLTVRFDRGRSFALARGGRVLCSVDVDAAGGCYEATIAPTFVPAHLGLGEDQRELSALLVRCSIIRASGGRTELFPIP